MGKKLTKYKFKVVSLTSLTSRVHVVTVTGAGRIGAGFGGRPDCGGRRSGAAGERAARRRTSRMSPGGKDREYHQKLCCIQHKWTESMHHFAQTESRWV